MAFHPTILKADGKPAFVVLPYAEYLELVSNMPSAAKAKTPRIPGDDTIPHEVISMMVDNEWSVTRAWREYLGLTQVDMASRMNVRQPTYAKMEAPDAKPRRSTRERLAAAFGLSPEQLNV